MLAYPSPNADDMVMDAETIKKIAEEIVKHR
jgi:hypothetical protein